MSRLSHMSRINFDAKNTEKFNATFNQNDRAQTANNIDVHIFLLPKHNWKEDLNLVFNEAVRDAISLGFLRVDKNLNLIELSKLIRVQCATTNLPENFLYIKSVGRAFTLVKEKQEHELKVKHFVSPEEYAAEVFLIDSEEDLPRNEDTIENLDGLLSGNNFNDRENIKPNTLEKFTEPSEGLNDAYEFTLINRGQQTFLSSAQTEDIQNTERNSSNDSDFSRMQENQKKLEEKQQALAELRLLKERNEAALRIQRHYRGYQGRNRARAMAEEKAEALQNQLNNDDTQSVEQLANKLNELKDRKLELQTMREELIRYVKYLHNQITLARKEARVIWKKNYFIEKKKAPKVKETIKTNLNLIENWQEKNYQQFKSTKPGTAEEITARKNMLEYVKLQDSVFLLDRQVEQAKLKFSTDLKLRNQADAERVSLRSELINTKTNIVQLKKNY